MNRKGVSIKSVSISSVLMRSAGRLLLADSVLYFTSDHKLSLTFKQTHTHTHTGIMGLAH